MSRQEKRELLHEVKYTGTRTEVQVWVTQVTADKINGNKSGATIFVITWNDVMFYNI
jgi:hypothetical protein